MSEITSDILAKIAPSTAKGLRDRFLPFLNEALPRYEITSRLRVAAFLTTTAFESAYFRATKEGKAKPNTKAGRAQAKYWSTGFYGRGIIQTTHEEGYQAVGDYLADKGVIDDADQFVNHPELLEQPKWAVESACVFWTQNGLNRYADSKKIFAIEGITNRGDAGKPAWGEPEREALYKKVLSILPQDFGLSSAADVSTPQGNADPAGGEPSPITPPVDDAGSQEQQPPSLWERITNWKSKTDSVTSQINDFQETGSSIANVASPVSKSSWAATAIAWLKGTLLLLWGVLSSHPVYAALGTALIIAAIAYLHFAKQRGRNGNTPQVAQTQKIEVNA